MAHSRLALCIGINEYPGTGNDLNGCLNDVEDWQATFESRGFAVNTLVGRAATGSQIRSAISNLMRSASPGDYLAVHFSGHGSFVPDQNGDEPDGFDECLCPVDVGSGGAIRDDELQELYALRPSGARLVVISDCCHSGSIVRYAPRRNWPGGMRQGRTVAGAAVRFLPPSQFLQAPGRDQLPASSVIRRAAPRGPQAGLLLAACQDAERSQEDFFQGRANGVFTYTALWALRKLPARATFRDWFNRIRHVLPNQSYPQTPNLFGSQSMKEAEVFE